MNWPNLDVRELWGGWSRGRSGNLVGQVVDLLAFHDTWMGFLFLFVVLAALWLGAPPLVAFFVDAVLKTEPPSWLGSVCKGGGYFLALVAWSLLVVANGMSDARNRNLTFGIIVAVGLIVALIVADGSMPFLLILLISVALQVVVPFYIGDTRKENAKYDMPKFAMFAMFFLGAWLMLTMPLPAKTAATVPQGQPVQQSGVLPTLTPQPVLVPANTAVPTAAPKPANTPAPSAASTCQKGLIPAIAKNAFAWDESSPGSNQLFELRVDIMRFSGSETLTSAFKEPGGGQIFCQTSKKNGSTLVWWKAK